MKRFKYIIGIDEVGRGALAGPVTVAAILLPRNFQFSISHFQKKSKIRLKDSKKLSPKQREIWFQYIKQLALSYRIASVAPKIIDKINISNAANLAATRAIYKLLVNPTIVGLTSKKNKEIKVFLDGGLHIDKSKIKNQKSKLQFKIQNFKNLKTKTIIKGDERIPAISLASIVAKVSRDRYMKKLQKKYPQYDFIHNVGYGTKKHIKAIKKYGLSSIHRQTFRAIH